MTNTLLELLIAVTNGNNIMIPKEARASNLKEIHSSHLGTKMMKNIFCGRFFWRRINEDFERIHHIEFAIYNKQDIQVIKDRSTGFIAAVLCKDQSTAVSVKALMTWWILSHSKER